MPLRNSCLEGVIGLTKLDEISAEFAFGKEDLFARIGLAIAITPSAGVRQLSNGARHSYPRVNRAALIEYVIGGRAVIATRAVESCAPQVTELAFESGRGLSYRSGKP